jgi:small subunit ribosomal protein S24e
MEIIIDSKRNNPLLNRTEIYFTVKHEGEGTPNREIIRSELAEKINVNKEKVIINNVQSSFGSPEISCYAKIYPSLKQSKEIERDYILKRNKLIESEKDKTKKSDEEKKPEEIPKEKPAEEKPEEKTESDESKEPIAQEKTQPDTVQKEEKKEKVPEPEKTEEKKLDEKPKEELDKKTENTTDEKKD